MRPHASLVVALTLAVLIPAAAAGRRPAAAEAPIVLRLATADAGDSPRNLAAHAFARVAGEASKGRIKVEVDTDSRLARGESGILERTQLGTIDVAPVGGTTLAALEPGYLPLDLPFLWTSREQAWRVTDGPVGRELFRRLESQGVKGLCFGGGRDPGHAYSPTSWLMNLKRYQGLPPELRQAAHDASRAACARERTSERVRVDEAPDLAAQRVRSRAVYDEVTARVGREWMDRVLAAAQAAREYLRPGSRLIP